MKPKIWIEMMNEHGLVNLSRFCRFVNTTGGQYDAGTNIKRSLV